jgi:hypothetical protein
MTALAARAREPVGDLNGDGVIGAADLDTSLAGWGPLKP